MSITTVTTSVPWRLILRVIAAFLFFLATIIGWGSASYDHAAALVPGGLLFLTVSLF